MNQPDLFKQEPHPPFQRGSETSHEAAHRVLPHVANMKRAVLMTYASFGKGGATRQQVADAGPYVEATVCARTVDLMDIGALEPTGEKGRTRSGFPAGILKITQAGAAMLAGSQKGI